MLYPIFFYISLSWSIKVLHLKGFCIVYLSYFVYVRVPGSIYLLNPFLIPFFRSGHIPPAHLSTPFPVTRMKIPLYTKRNFKWTSPAWLYKFVMHILFYRFFPHSLSWVQFRGLLCSRSCSFSWNPFSFLFSSAVLFPSPSIFKFVYVSYWLAPICKVKFQNTWKSLLFLLCCPLSFCRENQFYLLYCF